MEGKRTRSERHAVFHAESVLKRALLFFSFSFLYPTSSLAVLRRERSGEVLLYIESEMIEVVDLVCACVK